MLHEKRPTDWYRVEKFLKTYRQLGKVSVSGGGDPLFRYAVNSDWWATLFRLTERLDMKVDVHTRERLYEDNFWLRINRCSLSSDDIKEDIEFLTYLITLANVRIVHVVTKKTTTTLINTYIDIAKQLNCQLTFKELVGYSDGRKYKKYKTLYPNYVFLDKGDYNLYYMPDNTIRSTFLLKNSSY